jgi:hypothetical protein
MPESPHTPTARPKISRQDAWWRSSIRWSGMCCRKICSTVCRETTARFDFPHAHTRASLCQPADSSAVLLCGARQAMPEFFSSRSYWQDRARPASRHSAVEKPLSNFRNRPPLKPPGIAGDVPRCGDVGPHDIGVIGRDGHSTPSNGAGAGLPACTAAKRRDRRIPPAHQRPRAVERDIDRTPGSELLLCAFVVVVEEAETARSPLRRRPANFCIT